MENFAFPDEIETKLMKISKFLNEAFYLHHWEIGWANFSDFVTVYSDFPENRI